MFAGWSPAAINDLSKVGFLLVLVVLTTVALSRGWVVLGPYHRELMAMKDKELQKADVRAAKDAETIAIQAQTIADKNASEAAAEAMIKAFRDSVTPREST